MNYDLFTLPNFLQYVCVCVWVYTCLCFYVFLCVYGFCVVPVRMYVHLLTYISFLADQDPSYCTADRRDRAKQPTASCEGRQVIGNFALLPVHSHEGYIPPSNTQMHQQMKLHNYFNSDSLHFGLIMGDSLISSTII
jgi:hypothetical protein